MDEFKKGQNVEFQPNREILRLSRTIKLQYSISNSKELLLQKHCNKIVSCLNMHSTFEKALQFGMLLKSTVFCLEPQFV